MKKNTIFVLAALLFWSWYWCSCATKIEGCTEPLARNFDAEADKNCCCTYYQLQWSMRHFVADTNQVLQLSSPFTDAQGTILTPQRLDFLISDVELVDANGVAWSVQDSLQTNLRDGSLLSFPNSFATLNPNGLIYKFGKFAQFGEYSILRFRVGLGALAAQIDGQEVSPATHPLGISASPLMYDSTNNIYNNYQLILANVNADTTYTLISTESVVADIAVAISVRDGADTNIFIDVFYSRLFDGIDWAQDSETVVKAKIRQNLPNIFALRI
jgi:hypothetical protein